MRDRHHKRVSAVAFVLAALILVLVSGCTGSSGDAASAENVLRSVRLAGFEQASVGTQGSEAWVRLELPALDSAADAEIAWQVGYASLASAYPQAKTYRVEIGYDDEPLLRAEAAGEEVRSVIDADDATALRTATTFTYLLESTAWESAPDDVVTMPADLSSRYLDAQNAAASLLASGPVGWGGPTDAAALRDLTAAMRGAVEGKSAVAGDEALQIYSERIVASLDGSAEGEDAVVARVEDVIAGGAENMSSAITGLRTIATVTEAVSHDGAYGSTLKDARALADSVVTEPLARGPVGDAVLVAAGDATAPESMRSVDEFERDSELDVAADAATGTGAGAALLAVDGQWTDTSGAPHRFAASDWEAWRRADGVVFWRSAQEPTYALTDDSTIGWAFSRTRVAVLNAEDVGEVLGTLHSSRPILGGE